MKRSELKQLIREEAKIVLREESSLESKVADLYAYTGVKTQYSDDNIKRYGQEVIDLAIQMAPKIQKAEQTMKALVKKLKQDPDVKMLLLVQGASNSYGGGSSRTSLGELINRYGYED